MTKHLTQWDRIYHFLRARKRATTYDLVVSLSVLCGHKRIREHTDSEGYVLGTMKRERIERTYKVLPSGARIVVYTYRHMKVAG